MNKIQVGILGATGMVGQNYLRLLVNHPWFEVVVFTASVLKYGDPLLDKLDIHKSIHHRLFRDSCYNYEGCCYERSEDRKGQCGVVKCQNSIDDSIFKSK